LSCSASASSSSTLPSALLFDCDGVLVDTEKDGHRISFNDTFQEVGTSHFLIFHFSIS
jgi:beta-phosphoglucomutase-like phosphatase (HAD superfamily)